MKRILVVDSDPRMCQAIYKVLQGISCSVVFAFDAVAAVTEARKHNPDLMIVDLSLPAGSGLVVVGRLRGLASHATVPIIVMAERGARLEAEKVFDAGANAFLPKPLNPRLLLHYVNSLLPSQAPRSMAWETVQI